MILVRVTLGDVHNTAVGPDGKSVRRPGILNPLEVLQEWMKEHHPQRSYHQTEAQGPSYGWWFAVTLV